MKDLLTPLFIQKFGTHPLIFRSPGRINLIGEHTDYNNGFVLPAAVDKAMWFAIARNDKDLFRFHARDLNEDFETPVDQIGISDCHWANYLLGVIAQFAERGSHPGGLDVVFGGNIPLGAGMSSSAALEAGMAFALNEMMRTSLSRMDLAFMAQKAEHTYAGVQCGIMDQFASLHGQSGQVLQLDCRSLDYSPFPFNTDENTLILVNTGVKHALASSEYNIRRQECEQGVRILQQHFPEVESLRDATLGMLQKCELQMSEVVYQRCAYILEENQRVLDACDALTHDDMELFGQLMFESHEGLRDQYEVSCDELDQLVELALTIPGVLGSRMMGGGFGGCTLNLMSPETAPAFISTINEHYRTPDGEQPEIYTVVIDDGSCGPTPMKKG